MSSQPTPLYRYSYFVACATLFLILAGGLVTSHQAGLSVPDWPLSFGQVFPPMRGLMVWEHGHRLIAAFVGLLSLILTFWVTLKEKRKSLIGLAWFSLALVFLQGLLGGLTVLLKLPASVSIAHAVIGQTFLGLVVVIAFLTSPYYERIRSSSLPRRDTKQVRLSLFCLAFVYIQLFLGATVRHTAHAMIEHIVFAIIVTGHILGFAFYGVYRHPKQKNLMRFIGGMIAVLIAQIFLGIGAFTLKILIPAVQTPTLAKVIFTVLHQTMGAVVLGFCILLWLFSLYPDQENQ